MRRKKWSSFVFTQTALLSAFNTSACTILKALYTFSCSCCLAPSRATRNPGHVYTNVPCTIYSWRQEPVNSKLYDVCRRSISKKRKQTILGGRTQLIAALGWQCMWHVLLACCMMHLRLLVHFRAVASLVNSHYHPTICVLPFFFPPHHSRIHAPAATFFSSLVMNGYERCTHHFHPIAGVALGF